MLYVNIYIQQCIGIIKNIFFSTQLKPMGVPNKEWDYYGFARGQYVSFYSLRALELLAKRFGLHLASTGYLHFFSETPINNHEFRKVARGASERTHIFLRRSRIEVIARRVEKFFLK